MAAGESKPKCPKCFVSVKPDAVVCPNCGQRLEKVSQLAPYQSEAPPAEFDPQSQKCPHCGSEIRTGMVRCRDCNHIVSGPSDSPAASERRSVPAQPHMSPAGDSEAKSASLTDHTQPTPERRSKKQIHTDEGKREKMADSAHRKAEQPLPDEQSTEIEASQVGEKHDETAQVAERPSPVRSRITSKTLVTAIALSVTLGLVIAAVLILTKRDGKADRTRLDELEQPHTLDLSRKEITDREVTLLRKQSSLRKLYLDGAKITDAQLEPVQRMTGLRWLYLKGAPITDAGLAHLSGLKRIDRLHLYGTDITDKGLVHLNGLKGLIVLGLSRTKVTDAGLKHLTGLRNLQTLGLSRTQITDAGLSNLKYMTKLKRLNLSQTKVTDVGVSKLQQSLPNCKIKR